MRANADYDGRNGVGAEFAPEGFDVPAAIDLDAGAGKISGGGALCFSCSTSPIGEVEWSAAQGDDAAEERRCVHALRSGAAMSGQSGQLCSGCIGRSRCWSACPVKQS